MPQTRRILCILGTRPEAIKLAPVIHTLGAHPGIDLKVCVTGQHRSMLDQVLKVFDIKPDVDLAVMKPGQDLTDITAAVLDRLRPVLTDMAPERIIVQGDTTTTFAGALAAYYHQIPVAHVEAGLRTGDLYAPWPEEGNRRMTSVMADRHYAPTATARDHLLAEGLSPDAVTVTGNTVIDALMLARDLLERDPGKRAEAESVLPRTDSNRKMILVTGHRRENFGPGFERVCMGIRRLAERGDVDVVYPVHLNPNVREPVQRILGSHDHIRLIEPLDYLPFITLMDRAHLVLTDSGGVQEEAPSLGKPVLVMRETTERPEAVHAGTVRLVGTDERQLVDEAARLLDDPEAYRAMSRATNPYGDGKAAPRILEDLVAVHDL
ncbi:MAG: non-hydrolyzing UDP-N-acetylglucosamine 2-epimerase [Alphaproteobacteria bacterium]